MKSKRILSISLLLVFALMLVFVVQVMAVHDTGAFQLDGDAVSSVISNLPPDDWDRVCHEVLGMDCSTTFDTNGAIAVDWTEDSLLDGTPSLQASIFTGGGSKDQQDIDQWAWKDGAGGLPDKDNLLHSFAARYSLPDSADCPAGSAPTCEVLFFGSDRYDNSGDAQQGFWFFQQEITLGDQKVGGGTSFNGLHQVGDLLVISEFSNGGTTSTILVYEWVGSGGSDGTLDLLASSESANCAQVPDNDEFCGIVNPANGTVAPWPFLDKSGNNTYLNGEFFEGGINLSALDLADRCFASVASETRSSTSLTATLKDFVLGSFGNCETSLVTTPVQGSSVSIGTGSVSVQDSAELTIVGIPTWDGTLSFYLCGPSDLDVYGLCSTGGTQVGGSDSVTEATSQPILSASTNVTAAGDYCWRGEFISGTEGVPDATDSSEGECFTVTPVTPTITTTATAGPVYVGTAIDDTATLSGTANQPDGSAANGTITFYLYGPDDSDCSDPAIATSEVTVSGDGMYTASIGSVTGSLTPTAAGTYYWIASYSGDSPNTNSASTSCGDPNESSVVQQQQPSMETAQSFVPNDAATITVGSSTGGALAGNVVFELYVNDAVCSGTAAYTSAPIDITTGSGSDTSRTVMSNNTTAYTESSTFTWVVTFTSTNPAHANVSSPCGNETSSIMIDNGIIQPQP